MKAKLLILLGLLIGLVACNDENAATNINGEYIGVFERNGNTAAVELTFSNGTFSGESEFIKFPALCNGTYTTSGNTITFVNSCIWTAEFDWTLILGGEWDFTFNTDVLTLNKSNGDKYILTKQ